MPEIGAQQKDREIARPDKGRTFEYCKCPSCGIERWVDVKEAERVVADAAL